MKGPEVRAFPFFILIYPIPFLCIFLTFPKTKTHFTEMVSGFNLCYNSVTIFAKNLIIPVIFPFCHATHTYSEADLFVCADIAVNVWNMVKIKGINARIAAGNVNKPHADWTCVGCG